MGSLGAMSPRRPDMPSLDRDDLLGDPIAQFSAWWTDAEEVPLRDAMTLATVDADGRPDARMVLLKGFGTVGFRFFTNYESAKAAQLDAAGPRGARPLLARARPAGAGARADRAARRRRVRRVLREPPARLAARRLGLAAEPAARRPGRARRAARRGRRSDSTDGEVSRPEHWGGYVVRHESVEFWQGQVGRLHDRFRYRRDGDGWAIERLGP